LEVEEAVAEDWEAVPTVVEAMEVDVVTEETAAAAVIESIVRWLRTLPRDSIVGTDWTSSSDTLIARPVLHAHIDGPSTEPGHELAEDLEQLAPLSEMDDQTSRNADSSSARSNPHRTCARLCVRCIIFPPGVVHHLEHELQHHMDHRGRSCSPVKKSIALTCGFWAPGVLYAFYTLGKHKQSTSCSRPGRPRLHKRSVLVMSEPSFGTDEEIIQMSVPDEASIHQRHNFKY